LEGKPSVTFETKCWDGDWEILLKTQYLDNMISRNDFTFEEKVLYINNVNNPDEVIRYAESKIERGILTRAYLVDKHAEEALDFFGVSKSELGRGYVYSISELVGVFLCKTEFLLHFSGDTIMVTRGAWIPSSIEAMSLDPRLKVANPTWNMKYHRAREASCRENDTFFIGYGFSDQCYLVRRDDFRSTIYNERHPFSDRHYPHYGGDSFEKRVGAWMLNHDHQRLTHKHVSYIHKNFPRSSLKKRMLRLLHYYDFFPRVRIPSHRQSRSLKT
jgi:hypothetical protein